MALIVNGLPVDPDKFASDNAQAAPSKPTPSEDDGPGAAMTFLREYGNAIPGVNLLRAGVEKATGNSNSIADIEAAEEHEAATGKYNHPLAGSLGEVAGNVATVAAGAGAGGLAAKALGSASKVTPLWQGLSRVVGAGGGGAASAEQEGKDPATGAMWAMAGQGLGEVAAPVAKYVIGKGVQMADKMASTSAKADQAAQTVEDLQGKNLQDVASNAPRPATKPRVNAMGEIPDTVIDISDNPDAMRELGIAKQLADNPMFAAMAKQSAEKAVDAATKARQSASSAGRDVVGSIIGSGIGTAIGGPVGTALGGAGGYIAGHYAPEILSGAAKGANAISPAFAGSKNMFGGLAESLNQTPADADQERINEFIDQSSNPAARQQ
jgi:hypothetical protein